MEGENSSPYYYYNYSNSEMAESSGRAKRIRKGSSSSSSSSSCLPSSNPLGVEAEDILHDIFTFLPIKEAVKMGTVAKRFHNTWVFSRKFVFDHNFSSGFTRDKLTKVINHAFDSHKGHEILSFHLHIDPHGVEHMIAKWLEISINKGVEELDLFFRYSKYTLEAVFFQSLKKLRNLRLINCKIEIPPVKTLPGLRFLSTLMLWQLRLSEDNLKDLVSHCKILSVIDLFQCIGIQQITVEATNHKYLKVVKVACCPDVQAMELQVAGLRSIFYGGDMIRFRFGGFTALKEAFFNIHPNIRSTSWELRQLEVIVNNHFERVRVLSISAVFPEVMGARIRPDGSFQEAQFCLPYVRELQLFMDTGRFCNPYDIFSFLNKCPSLQSLFIDLNDYRLECGIYWEIHHKAMLEKMRGVKLNKLRIVKLKGFKFDEAEIELMKILIQTAIRLEYLILVSPNNARTGYHHPIDDQRYYTLFHSLKASPNAHILLLTNLNDNTFHPFHPKYWY